MANDPYPVFMTHGPAERSSLPAICHLLVGVHACATQCAGRPPSTAGRLAHDRGRPRVERAARSNAVNMRAVVAYTTPLVLVAFGLLLFIAWRRGRLARTFVAATVVLAVAWGLALAAIWADYSDVVEARPSTPLLSDG